MPGELRRDSIDEESSGESTTTRVLVMLAILVSLVAVLGMLQVREKRREPVPWPTSYFEAGVAVQAVTFEALDATANVVVDEAGWRQLGLVEQQAIGQRFAQVAAPQGAKKIRITGSGGTPLAIVSTTGSTTGTIALPAPPLP